MNSLTCTHIEPFLCVCMCTGTNVCMHAGPHGCMDAHVCTWEWRPEINLRGCSSASIYFAFWEVVWPVSTWNLSVSAPLALGVQVYTTISFFKTNKQKNKHGYGDPAQVFTLSANTLRTDLSPKPSTSLFLYLTESREATMNSLLMLWFKHKTSRKST